MSYHLPTDKIMLYPGSVIDIGALKVGDSVFGPDSKPRKVLKIKKYKGKIYKITSKKKHVLYVKDDTLLFLKKSRQPEDKQIEYFAKITIIDFMDKGVDFRFRYKLYSRPLIFGSQELIIEPYFLGVLLGDGSMQTSVGVTTEDVEIKQETYRQAEKYGLYIRVAQKKNNNATTYFMSGIHKIGGNRIINCLRNLDLLGTSCGDKFIPQQYIFNSTANRFNMLAGLLDTDGCNASNGFEFVSKSNQLACDICMLARSLGFSTSNVKCIKTCQNNFSGEYNRVYISGDTNLIPVRLERKKCTERKQIKDVKMSGFSYELINDGKTYYGIKVDEDNMYLDDNFVVLCGI